MEAFFWDKADFAVVFLVFEFDVLSGAIFGRKASKEDAFLGSFGDVFVVVVWPGFTDFFGVGEV